MSDPLDLALHSYRFWRDIGADILIVALLVEFLIEAWWPEQPHKTHVGLSRKQAMTAAAFIVFAGVGIERIWGTLADDKSDEIRINLQERLIRVSPRIWLFSGDALDRVSVEVKRFSGQRVAVFANQASVDDRQEVLSFAISLDAVLGGAGWLGPIGKKIRVGPNGLPTNLSLDPPDRSSVEMILIETRPTSSSETKMAADTLASALNSERVFAYVHKNSNLAGLNVPTDDDVIAITVGRRLLP